VSLQEQSGKTNKQAAFLKPLRERSGFSFSLHSPSSILTSDVIHFRELQSIDHNPLGRHSERGLRDHQKLDRWEQIRDRVRTSFQLFRTFIKT
jgi:hypothetical protein